MGGPERRDVAGRALLPAMAGLGAEPRAVGGADGLVDRGEAERRAAGETGHRARVAPQPGEHGAAGGVGPRAEERVGPPGIRTYNHSVIRERTGILAGWV